jgi:hypothetical protein
MILLGNCPAKAERSNNQCVGADLSRPPGGLESAPSNSPAAQNMQINRFQGEDYTDLVKTSNDNTICRVKEIYFMSQCGKQVQVVPQQLNEQEREMRVFSPVKN